ncbi:hypothetical protein, partial [Klebsiella variicola]|uniref:hypothetical protein n=1 Tax=Klebsiella variicola TaxID=244366 RepID=UPI001C6FC9FA
CSFSGSNIRTLVLPLAPYASIEFLAIFHFTFFLFDLLRPFFNQPDFRFAHATSPVTILYAEMSVRASQGPGTGASLVIPKIKLSS